MHERVLDVLDANPTIKWRELRHNDFDVPIKNASDFAECLTYQIERITKTILLSGDDDKKRFCLIILSSNQKFDRNKLASLLNVKKIQVASIEELKKEIGFPHSGVSPLSIYKMPIFIDESLVSFTSILIGSGEVGAEIEISPIELIALTNASVESFTLRPDYN